MALTPKAIKLPLSHRLSGIEEYYFSQKLRQIAQYNEQGRDIINLGIGSPDMPPHQSVIDALTVTAQKPNVHGYQSYKGVPALRQAFSQWYNDIYGVALDADSEILPLIGSKEGIMHICMTFLNKGDKVLLPNPGYPTYTSAVKIAGGEPLYYNLKADNQWQVNLDELEQLITSNTKLLFVNYPHMPTGTQASNLSFEKLVAFARKHSILICHDNPYSFILNEEEPLSILAIEGAIDVCIELNSLSKSHNMAGWRVGVLVANSYVVEQILKFKSNMDSGMFLALQNAAIAALKLDKIWYDNINQVYKIRQSIVLQIAQILGCQVTDRQAGLFIWGAIPSKYRDGFEFADFILEKANVFITPGGIFGTNGNQYVRMSLCADAKILQLAKNRINAI